MTTDGGADTTSPREPLSTREVVLAFVVFCVLLGQPVVVFALSLLTPDPASLSVIGLGTALLAGSVTRLFVRRRGSVDRLADFVLALAGVQVFLALLGQLAVGAVGAASLPVDAAAPVLVLVGYPVAYYLVYHGPPVAPLSLGSRGG